MKTALSSKGKVLTGAGLVVAVVAAGGGVALAVNSDSGPRYRLATASVASVEQTLTSVGTVSAVNRASVAFPVSGTVATVNATVGEKVSAGQLLASLATGSLQQQVASANANLASAQQNLATDEASQTETASTDTSSSETASTEAARSETASSETADTFTTSRTGAETTSTATETGVVLTAARPGGTSTGTSAGKGGAGSSGAIAKLAAAVTSAQKQVLRAQQALDADLDAAEAALTQCRSDLTQPSASPTDTPSATPTATATAPATDTASPTSSSPATDSGSADCLSAIGQAPNQARITADRNARTKAETALDKAVQALIAAAGKSQSGTGSGGTSAGGTGSGGTGSGSGRSTTGQTGGSTGSGKSSRSGSSSGTGTSSGGQSGGGRASSGPASAEQLAADQAQIDAAQAELAVAQQGVAEATLTSPLAGTVAAVSITAGKSVGAASSSATITVIGSGQEQVSTTVGLADVDSVKVGQQATVRVDGIGQALTGKVASIGILNTGSGSTTSYPVTVVLDPSSAHLYDGSGASVQIQIASVNGVLTVPSSAVRTVGTLNTVTVLTKGKPVLTRITVGAVGDDRTQVKTGLSAGQQVVLADLSQPLPSTRS